MNFLLENATEYVSKAYGIILTGAGIWAGWFFKKSKALKKADDESASANMVKEWVLAIDTATAPFKEEIAHVRSEFKELQSKYIELSIQVGILTKENDRKDTIIRELETENKTLKSKIDEYESRKLSQAHTNKIENIG